MLDPKLVLSIIAAYVASIAIGWITINPICHWLGRKYFPDLTWDRFLPRIVGGLEQFMYTTALLMGFPGFLVVWLALKLAGEWRMSERHTSYAMYNIFLVGNSLSLILSVGTAALVKNVIIPAFPV